MRLGVKTCYGHTVTELSADQSNAWVTSFDDEQQTRETFDGVGICAGVGSRALGAKLGDRVNIYQLTGYSMPSH